MENTTEIKTEIKTGDIVLYQGGWYRVRKCTKNLVNLGSIFGRTLYHKGVPKDQVKEDQENWYTAWQKTETYQSM
jgi:hypothetical protein